ncbi:tetratricopeptide (TPR) repeat protein [Kitasatospora sp. MAA19]|uniref:ATP-binding protein n=1 Tax=Kitasatospora sp. MAA19 TaxID=3035090 RepID=UPI00247380C6|nr:tetratricopeptide repeat protein [Kitasatospora sp. MAA19]MDH6708873.1 tetratricopeptide (TPR) repeat protein [Kitasatospora sp. MAA19]
MPDPGNAADLTEFIGMLGELRAWAGMPSYRSLAKRAGPFMRPARVVSPFTVVDAFKPGRRRLDLDLVVAIVRALGLEGAEAAQWRDACLRVHRGARTRGPNGVPRQLPAAARHFTGRTRELQELDELLGDRIPSCGAVVISAIAGTAGVGKTSLAVHFAHRVAHRFPDGQLFANLRGFDPAGPPTEPANVARGFLDALGVPAPRIPADPDGRLALYRSRLAGTRTLIVLDNAREAAQVRPLLPGSDTCLVLVTSRNRMPGLVALDGAVPLALDVLSREEARELLARRMGPEAVLGQPDVADELIDLCARLPLALNIAAARAAERADTPLSTWTRELHDTRARLDLLSADDSQADVRAVLSWSYHALAPQAARLFRLLGLHPGPRISAAAAVSLAGLPLAETRRLLDELHRAHLITAVDRDWYTFHDLLRAYAAELVATDSTSTQTEASRRMLDHYLCTAHRAGSLAYADDASWHPLDLPAPAVGVTPEVLTDRGQALAWYQDEQSVVEQLVSWAHRAGYDDHAWQLAAAQVSYLQKSGLWQQWQQVSETALGAAERAADLARQAHAHRWLGQVHRSQGRQPQAHLELRLACDLFGTLGELTCQGKTQLDIAITHGEEHAYAEAVAEAHRALALFESTGDSSGQALALNLVSWYLTRLGRAREALPYGLRALELARSCGSLPAQSSIWDSIGYIHHHLGEYEQALPAYHESLRLRQAAGDYFLQAEIHTHIGDAHLALGDTEAARHAWTQSLAILEHLQHRDADAVRARLDTNTARQP